jgi:hypothetical protein
MTMALGASCHALVLGLLLGVAACAIAGPGTAASPARLTSADPNGPAWSQLTPAQRSALAPLQGEWAHIDAGGRQKWLDIAARFPSMPEAERQRVQTRMSEWTRLSPQERGTARLHFQEAKQLSPAERQALWERYQALPPDQRREWAERAAPAQRASKEPQLSATAASASSNRKSNLVSPSPVQVRPVAPTMVQARPGATTTLMSRPPAPPPHQQPGLPKVAATPGFVDGRTLLPQRGAQAAATRAAAASAPTHP